MRREMSDVRRKNVRREMSDVRRKNVRREMSDVRRKISEASRLTFLLYVSCLAFTSYVSRLTSYV